MLLDEIARTSAAVGQTRSRLAKIELLAATLRRLGPDEIPLAVAYLSGILPQGTVGVGWASLRRLPPSATSPPTLELREVHAALDRIAVASGKGSQAARRGELTGLFARTTEQERRFLLGLLSAMAVGEHPLALLGAGFCGGFTTYSAFAVQTHGLARVRASAYAVATIGGALLACALGYAIGQA